MKKLLFALAFSLLATCANAATCFWVGGTGTWSTANTASWASSTGGTTGTCAATGGIPKQAGDIATFDASSGGGTVTVSGTLSGATLAQITMGAFTGTLDFSANNPSLTLSSNFSVTGTGVRTLNLGSGTFTFTGVSSGWDAATSTNLTLSAASATLAFSAPGNTNPQVFNGGTSLTYGTISVAARSNASSFNMTGTLATIGTFNVTAPATLNFGLGSYTITNAIAWAGTSSSQLFVQGQSNSSPTITVASGSTIAWAGLVAVRFAGTTVTATNSFDFKSNTGVTITPPSSGGGSGHIIGG